MSGKTTKLVRGGKLIVEVLVELIEDDTGWSPYVSVDDANRLDAIRRSLLEGDVAAASQLGSAWNAE